MQLNHMKVLRLMKLCFSAVLLQLFGICLFMQETAVRSIFLPDVYALLEYAALSAAITLGGTLALEYALQYYE